MLVRPLLEVSGLASFPRELHLNILTYLRATDLSAIQRTCSCFNKRDMINAVVDHAANEVVSTSFYVAGTTWPFHLKVKGFTP